MFRFVWAEQQKSDAAHSREKKERAKKRAEERAREQKEQAEKPFGQDEKQPMKNVGVVRKAKIIKKTEREQFVVSEKLNEGGKRERAGSAESKNGADEKQFLAEIRSRIQSHSSRSLWLRLSCPALPCFGLFFNFPLNRCF